MSDTAAELRHAIVSAARHMERSGHSPGTSGNVSTRHGDGFFITPTGLPPADLTAADVVVLDLEGNAGAGQRAPSSEWPMHAALYAARPKAGAVVHCHSRFATILACAHRSIPSLHYMVAATGGFDVPCAPYATFGTRALSDRVLETIGHRNGCLLANHGQIALGKDLSAAVRTAEEIERLAETHWGALAIGGPVLLTDEEMKDVVERFLGGYGQPG